MKTHRFPLRAATVAVSLGAALVVSGCSSQSGSTRNLQGPSVTGEGGEQQVQINNRAQMLFEDGVKAFDAQRRTKKFNYPQLEAKFNAALSADDRLAEADYNLGVLAERQGKKKDAVAHYQNALRKKPTLRQAAENLAVIAQNSGDTQAAANTYQQILDNFPDDASSRARLAELYRQNGDAERALELARQALIRDPKTLAAHKVMMLSYLDKRQLQMAKLVALRAQKLDESDPELYNTLGLVFLAEGDTVKAQSQFRKAVEARADYQPAHVQLAKLALKSEDYAGAEEHLRAILQNGGRSAEVFVNLGVAYKGMGQYDKAMQAYDEAEKMNPNLGATYMNRGIILQYHKDAPDRALQLYEKYLALANDDAGIGKDSIYRLIDEAKGAVNAREEMKRMEQVSKEEAAREAQQKKIDKDISDRDAKAADRAKAAGGLVDDDATNAVGKEGQSRPASKPAPAKKKASTPVSGDAPSDEPDDTM